MITKETYTIEYVNSLREKYKKDPSLLERFLFAFGLLEAITRVGMPFIFKGGTSLMLILDHPLRLSTDIDILVKPGTDVDHYINEAAKIFPFKTFDVGRILRTFKIKKNVEVTDNGKDNF
jgi:predicted nucleotidyltransferase component of viral defense system